MVNNEAINILQANIQLENESLLRMNSMYNNLDLLFTGNNLEEAKNVMNNCIQIHNDEKNKLEKFLIKIKGEN